jgi:hypothetical protein
MPRFSVGAALEAAHFGVYSAREPFEISGLSSIILSKLPSSEGHKILIRNGFTPLTREIVTQELAKLK